MYQALLVRPFPLKTSGLIKHFLKPLNPNFFFTSNLFEKVAREKLNFCPKKKKKLDNDFSGEFLQESSAFWSSRRNEFARASPLTEIFTVELSEFLIIFLLTG